MDEIDIWRTAKIMMDAHGEDALVRSAMRADDALADGNLDAEAVWRRVMRAIEDLQRATPNANERTN